MRSRTAYPCSRPRETALRIRRSRVPGRIPAWSFIDTLLCRLGEIALALLSCQGKVVGVIGQLGSDSNFIPPTRRLIVPAPGLGVLTPSPGVRMPSRGVGRMKFESDPNYRLDGRVPPDHRNSRVCIQSLEGEESRWHRPRNRSCS